MMSSINSEADATQLDQLLHVAVAILTQAIEVVQDVLTEDQQLTQQSKYMPGSTIGKHLRHARDHYVLLAQCMTAPAPRKLSYDVRIRNTPMETSRTAAVEALQHAIGLLRDVVPRSRLNETITLEAVTPHNQVLETTFGRELWFGSLHAVHHWSMVRVIAGEMGLTLKDEFGFAPSTLVHHGSESTLGASGAKM